MNSCAYLNYMEAGMMKAAQFHNQGAHYPVLQKEQSFRKTGIEIIGEIPWGTHFCMFYKSKYDLLEIPYLRAGLENREFCMWITSKPLTKSATFYFTLPALQ